MLKLDNNLLEELGLGSLPEAQKRQMLQHIYDTLELRVGTQLANQMTDKQLEEFEKFIDSGGDANQAQALQWLETNLPNYKDVVQQTFDSLKVEVKGMAPQLLASAAQQPQEAQIVSPQPAGVPIEPQYAAAQPQMPYASPQQPPAVTPQQVMPSQQAPVDANQSWQQPVQPQQQPAAYVPQAPYQPQPTAPVQPMTTPSMASPVPDPSSQQPQAFAQPQSTPTPPPTAAWQPAPSVQPWQPGPPNQQPPQAAA